MIIYAVLGVIGFVFGKWAGAITLPLSCWLLTHKSKIFNLKKAVTALDEYPKTYFLLMGYTAKLDGTVLPAHIRLAEKVIPSFRKGCPEKKLKSFFEQGKKMNRQQIESLLAQSALRWRGREPIRRSLVEIVYLCILHGYGQSATNTKFLKLVCERLDLNYSQMILKLEQTHGGGKQMDIQTAFSTLGVSPDAEIEVIKMTRKRKLNQYHPDKMIHASEKERESASHRVNQINQAYKEIRQYKGF